MTPEEQAVGCLVGLGAATAIPLLGLAAAIAGLMWWVSRQNLRAAEAERGRQQEAAEAQAAEAVGRLLVEFQADPNEALDTMLGQFDLEQWYRPKGDERIVYAIR